MVLSSSGFHTFPLSSIGKQKNGKRKKQRILTTHTLSSIATPPLSTHTEENKEKKGRFYEEPIWNEMDFCTDSHIWHCQQKLVGGPVSL